MVNPIQGEIWWVRLGHSGDSGPSGNRPAVVVQNDLLNKSNIHTTVVTLLTSDMKLASVPWNIRLKKGTANLPKSSVVVVSQMATVDKARLLEKIGTLRKEEIKKVIEGCQKVVSLEIF